MRTELDLKIVSEQQAALSNIMGLTVAAKIYQKDMKDQGLSQHYRDLATQNYVSTVDEIVEGLDGLFSDGTLARLMCLIADGGLKDG